MPYKFLEHTADVKFRAEGKTIEEMFSSAAGALFETIYGKVKINERIEKKFSVEGMDLEELIYNFLEEFLFLLDSENFLASRVKSIKIKGNKLNCVVLGDKASNYEFTNNVKAVTYSGMFVKKQKGKFVCEVVLDV